ncbi:hypothetical protein HDV00_001056 [Rhizophlyctis rosea]|nr:hypothetical protein HDV00_001056 [Rhizophlyctis rosea]
MGIPGIAAWLKKNYPRAVWELEGGKASRKGGQQSATYIPQKYHNVYIDMNSILHVVGRRANSEEHVVKKLFRSLDDVIKRLLAPEHRVYLAIDGPAPLAKLYLQKQRRALIKKKKKQGAFDTRNFTPGTEFMIKLDTFLSFYACRYLSMNTRHVPRLAFTVSGANVAGEGELKIIHHIRTRQPKIDSHTTAIIGSDGDIVLQTLLSRATNTHIINYDASTVFSPETMLESINARFPARDAYKISRDWACLVLLRGSDYLPKLPHTTLNRLWSAYLRIVSNRPDDYLMLDTPNGNLQFDLDLLGTILGGVQWRDPATWERMRREEERRGDRRFHDDDDDDGDDEDEEEAEDEEDDKMDLEASSSDDESEEDLEDEDDDSGDSGNSADMERDDELEDTPPVQETEVSNEIIIMDEEDDEEIIVFEPAVRRLATISSTSSNSGTSTPASPAPFATPMPATSAPSPSASPNSTLDKTAEYLSGILWILHMYQTGTPSTYAYHYPSGRGPSRVDVLQHIRAVEEGSKPVPACPQPVGSVTLVDGDAIHPLVCAAVVSGNHELLGKEGKHLIGERFHVLVDHYEATGAHISVPDHAYLTQLMSAMNPQDASSLLTQTVTFRNIPPRNEEQVPRWNMYMPQSPEGWSFEFRRMFVREVGDGQGGGRGGGGAHRGGAAGYNGGRDATSWRDRRGGSSGAGGFGPLRGRGRGSYGADGTIYESHQHGGSGSTYAPRHTQYQNGPHTGGQRVASYSSSAAEHQQHEGGNRNSGKARSPYRQTHGRGAADPYRYPRSEEQVGHAASNHGQGSDGERGGGRGGGRGRGHRGGDFGRGRGWRGRGRGE